MGQTMTTWYHWGPLRAIFGHFGVILAVRARGWSLELLHFFGHYRLDPEYRPPYNSWGCEIPGPLHILRLLIDYLNNVTPFYLAWLPVLF